MKPRPTLTLVVTFGLLLAGVIRSAPARGDDASTLTVPAVSAPPHLNGEIADSWKQAATAPVNYDFTYHRDGEPTTVYIAHDNAAIYVAFAVTQSEPITAVQQTNGAGVQNDDGVAVWFWPQGVQGFQYIFVANARGARSQSSSENTAYEPQWDAHANRTATGYSVTMRIPYDIMRSGGALDWHAQFERQIVARNSAQVWVHFRNQRNAADPAFSGELKGIATGQTAARPKPRLQLYGLGQVASDSAGGRTSRMGADIALPVTATSSLLATIHPDYSNVEVDQQTIAPNAYARRFNEVRPFFTQAATNFNATFSCTNCPATLYTPAIPQFRDGYAYEGTQGLFSFGAFDAHGYGRADNAQALDYTLNGARNVSGVALQRVAVDLPGVHDDTTSLYTGTLNNHTHYFEYLNIGEDRGTNVTDPGFGDYFEYGGGYASQLTTAGISLQKIGSQFAPLDGFVAQSDIAGYQAFMNRTLNFSSTSNLHDVTFGSFFARFHDEAGQTGQRDGSLSLAVDLRNLVSLSAFTGSTGIRGATGELLPFNSNGLFVGYKTKTSTPASISYSQGLFFHGKLLSWTYATTRPVRPDLNLSLETDENLYSSTLAAEPSGKQWLERVGLDWQFSRAASFVVGARRIIGRNLPNSFQLPDYPTAQAPCGVPNGFSPFDCVNAGNVSFAFHFLSAKNEYYVVYGNPNSLATTPALYLKWIRYIGAEKGT